MKLVFLILICVLTTSLSQDAPHAEVPKDHDQHIKDVPHAGVPKDPDQHIKDVPHPVKDVTHANIPKDHDQHVKDVTHPVKDVTHADVPKDHDQHVKDVPHPVKDVTHANIPKDHEQHVKDVPHPVKDVTHADVPKDHDQHVKDVPHPVKNVTHADIPKNHDQHVKAVTHADVPKDHDQRVKDVPHAEVPEGYEQHAKDVVHAQAPKEHDQHNNVKVDVEVVKGTAERALSTVDKQNFLICRDSQTVNCEKVCRTKNFNSLYYCQVTTLTGPYKQTLNCKCSLFDKISTTTEATTTEATTTEATTTPEPTTTETTFPTTTTVTANANIKANFDLISGSNAKSVGNSSDGNQTTTQTSSQTSTQTTFQTSTQTTPPSKTTKGNHLKGKTTSKPTPKKSATSKAPKKKLTSPVSSKKTTPHPAKKAMQGSKITFKPLKKITPAPKGSKTTPKPGATPSKALKGPQTTTNLCTSLVLEQICRPSCAIAKFSPTKACKISTMSCNCDLYAPKKPAGIKKAELSSIKLKKDSVCNCGENSPGSIFPWSVNIQVVQRKIALCSGVLISPTAVLITASCLQSSILKSTPIQNIRVMLDDKNPAASDGEVSVKIASTNTHPLYNKTGHLNNVAILTLESPVNLTQRINPICLVPASLIPSDQFIGVNVTAFGWTGTHAKWSEAGRLLSGVVQTEKCSSGFHVNPNNFDDFICAKTSSKDICNTGDGAVLSTVIRHKVRLIAMGSFSSDSNHDCSKNPAKGAFFKTSKVNDWILENTDALPCSN